MKQPSDERLTTVLKVRPTERQTMTITILAKSLYLFLIVEVVFSVNGTPFMFVLRIEYF